MVVMVAALLLVSEQDNSKTELDIGMKFGVNFPCLKETDGIGDGQNRENGNGKTGHSVFP